MISKRKIWTSISIVAGAGAASLTPTGVLLAGEAGEAGEGGYPGGNFADVLKKVLAGEGGRSLPALPVPIDQAFRAPAATPLSAPVLGADGQDRI